MKTKLFSIATLFSFFLIIAFSSCEGPMGPPGRDGLDGLDGRDGTDGRDGYVNKEIISFKVNKGDWAWDPANELYYFDFETPEMTSKIVNEGQVLGYMLLDGEYYPLEFTGNFYDEAAGIFYSETIGFRYKQGQVGFICKRSDLFDNLPAHETPQTYTLRIVMFW